MVDLRGTIAYVNSHPDTIALVQEGKVDLKPFITKKISPDHLIDEGFDTLIHHVGPLMTHEVSIDEAVRGFEFAADRTVGSSKVMLRLG